MQKALRHYEDNLQGAKESTQDEIRNLNSVVELENSTKQAVKRAKDIQRQQLKNALPS